MSSKIDISLVRKLREITKAPLNKCSAAACESGGDFDVAMGILRKTSAISAQKKSDRDANESISSVFLGGDVFSVVLLACETDFVAKSREFCELGNALATIAAYSAIKIKCDIDSLISLKDFDHNVVNDKYDVECVGGILSNAISSLGENIKVARVVSCEIAENEHIGYYVHGKHYDDIASGKGAAHVIIEADAPKEDVDSFAKNIAMHIFALYPRVVSPEDFPQDELQKEREVVEDAVHADNPNKKEDIINRIVNGKIKKFLSDKALLCQSYVKDPSMTIQEFVDKASKDLCCDIKIKSFDIF